MPVVETPVGCPALPSGRRSAFRGSGVDRGDMHLQWRLIICSYLIY